MKSGDPSGHVCIKFVKLKLVKDKQCLSVRCFHLRNNLVKLMSRNVVVGSNLQWHNLNTEFRRKCLQFCSSGGDGDAEDVKLI